MERGRGREREREGDYEADVRERISGYVLQYFSLAGVII